MNRIDFAALLLLLPSGLAQGGTCTDASATVTVSANTSTGQPTAIYGDGKDYVDGQDNVSALIRNCGTGDLTLNLNSANHRVINYDFNSVVAKNSTTPNWTTGPAFPAKAFLNVRNILYNYDAGKNYFFTTTFGTSFDAPDRKSYEFRMVNDSADAPPRQATDWVNKPCMTSLVTVQHLAATSTDVETWIATVDSALMTCAGTVAGTPSQLGTLISSSTKTSYNDGQFTMPFQITIRRKP